MPSVKNLTQRALAHPDADTRNLMLDILATIRELYNSHTHEYSGGVTSTPSTKPGSVSPSSGFINQIPE